MSDDPQTARQIAALAKGTRPLLVCDIDEVVLEFIAPFKGWLETRDLVLRTDSFRLNGNIVDRHTGAAVASDRVAVLIDGFFEDQEQWQQPADGAVTALERLSRGAEIVLLTAMPHRHYDRRARLLARHAIPYPLITTEAAKGPAVVALRGDSGRRVAFVDDIGKNHASVSQNVPDAGLVHYMAYRDLVPLMPPLAPEIYQAQTWDDAADRIAVLLSL